MVLGVLASGGAEAARFAARMAERFPFLHPNRCGRVHCSSAKASWCEACKPGHFLNKPQTRCVACKHDTPKGCEADTMKCTNRTDATCYCKLGFYPHDGRPREEASAKCLTFQATGEARGAPPSARREGLLLSASRSSRTWACRATCS